MSREGPPKNKATRLGAQSEPGAETKTNGEAQIPFQSPEASGELTSGFLMVPASQAALAEVLRREGSGQ
jgi:hypothetical protein